MTKPRTPARFRAFWLAAAALVLGSSGCDDFKSPPRRPKAAVPPAATLSGTVDCRAGPAGATAANAASLNTMPWFPFGRLEAGWAVYEPLIAAEIGARCPAGSAAFAARLAIWQKTHGLGGAGVLEPATFEAMKQEWTARRPFVAASHRACPPPPPQASLVTARADESYGGKVILLRPAALAAYRAMAAAARAALGPTVDAGTFTLFSGYRAPAADDARCASAGDCQNLTRAACS
ncbi:MAG: hypothetical protein ABI376_00320, partial [Caulobacteraceae bacterium]